MSAALGQVVKENRRKSRTPMLAKLSSSACATSCLRSLGNALLEVLETTMSRVRADSVNDACPVVALAPMGRRCTTG